MSQRHHQQRNKKQSNACFPSNTTTTATTTATTLLPTISSSLNLIMPWRGRASKPPNPALGHSSSQRNVVERLQDELSRFAVASSSHDESSASSMKEHHESTADNHTSMMMMMPSSSSCFYSLSDLLKHQGGLDSIPQSILESCLEPVMQGLADMDAEALLELEHAHSGPRIRDGTFVHAIHDNVTPPISPNDDHQSSSSSESSKEGSSVVRYIHLAEVPNQYSMGIFIFPPLAKIPLHDHPGMCVLSRVLYGDLKRISLDLLPENNNNNNNHNNTTLPQHYPAGTKRARPQRVDYLQAPDCVVLYPMQGNLHEFHAGSDGAAVLDVLLPPYNAQDRDCTFYTIDKTNQDDVNHNNNNNNNNSDVTMDNHNNDDNDSSLFYYIVPTGQPEDFHCISGQYKDIGSPS